MRLALIVPGFSAQESDWSIPALLDLARSLATRHDVEVFALRYPHSRQRYGAYGATVHPLGYATRGRAWRGALLADALAAVGREHRRSPFDLFHGLWADEAGFLAVTAGWLLQRPAIVSLMGGELVGLPDIGYGGQLSQANRRLARFALRRADLVSAGSRSLAALAQPLIPQGRLAVLPLGVDLERFGPATGSAGTGGQGLRLAGDPSLLHVASLVPVKDQATLLRAVAVAAGRHPKLHLHLVGAGPLRQKLAELAATLDLAGRVTFHGPVPHDQLPAYYQGADLLVLSSRFESQNMAVLEAAACGCPAVGTAVGLLPELLAPEQVVAVGDHEALGAAILRLAQHPEARAALGQVAHEAVVARYGLDKTVPALESAYRRAIDRT